MYKAISVNTTETLQSIHRTASLYCTGCTTVCVLSHRLFEQHFGELMCISKLISQFSFRRLELISFKIMSCFFLLT